MLDYDVSSGLMGISRPDGTTTEVSYPKLPEGGWTVEQDFVNSIRTGASVNRTDFATGLRYMKFTDAVWQAWQ